jgi:hypothetical protein
MNACELFKHVYEDLEEIDSQASEYGMLRASTLLRQLLLDGAPLIHIVNENLKLPILFPVCGVEYVKTIFELNPAPFCMLDEVDAPLDDANVARFCEIVREMSEKVQFVFITHNKVTMEMSRQLSGVTMQEPGVSRLVSVDLDEAVKMAAS